MLSLVLSAAHPACACIAHTSSDTHAAHNADAAMTETHHHAMTRDAMAKHEKHGAHSMGGDHSQQHQNAPCSTDAGDCAHVASINFFKATAKDDAFASLQSAPIEKPILTEFSESIFDRDAITEKRSAFLWRGPPIKSPVALKNRLLN